ncbi:MAG: response regulator, partial [Lachnospiraceae bacterium]|nr:response regulator [Lachnospiraceae bacterium]
NGVAVISENLEVSVFEAEGITGQYITELNSDSHGNIYGVTRNRSVFLITQGNLAVIVNASDLGGVVTAVYADPENQGKVYLGFATGELFYGILGAPASAFEKISIAPLESAEFITYACGRVWVLSLTKAGYLDKNGHIHVLDKLPLDNSLESMTEDYQGNLWFTSSRQGVAKVVSCDFRDVSRITGLEKMVVNTTCVRSGSLYIGTDSGLQILDDKETQVENELTEYLADTRIRCIVCDNDDNLWLCTYNSDKGLVRYSKDGVISNVTENDGLLSNSVRCAVVTDDGSLVVGSNGGVNILNDGVITKSFGSAEGMDNTVVLTVAKGNEKYIYAGTDGGGIYRLGDDGVKKYGRSEGLTSDVILRMRWDNSHNVFWIITSNSIEYMKIGVIVNVTSFPYNNNFDIFLDGNDKLWILSSLGVYCVRANSMLIDKVDDYTLYNTANGLPGIPTANSYSAFLPDGELYIAERNGVCSVNLNEFSVPSAELVFGIGSVISNNTRILPGEDGTYELPADSGRIQFVPKVLDYSLSNPTISVFLEGKEKEGITAPQNKLTSLEYTGLKYGSYVLYVQVVDPAKGTVFQEKTYNIYKRPRFGELVVVRVLFVALVAGIIGLVVWRITSGSFVRKQLEQVRLAKEEAERANGAKTRFFANISHEIRTPVNTIIGMDEMILRESTEGVPKAYCQSIAGYASDIKEASGSLLDMINNLLDMSKVEAGKATLVEQDYDTEEFLRSVVKMIRVRSDDKKLSFLVKVAPELPTRLFGDAGKIKQILLNLLTNAVKYTEYGGITLTVNVISKTDETCSLEFSVKDSGIGIKQEDMERLFYAYERLDEEKNNGVQGTGLGLDISRRYAELMGGTLRCESSYGEGSEFFFTVEQKIVDGKEIREFTESIDDIIHGPYVPQFIAPDADVLVVDDSPMNLTVIKNLLRETKMFVTTAGSGEECLEKIRYGNFNIVLLDYLMPGMDGVETVQRIRETHPDLPVYALTANAAETEDFYISKGFNGCLLKPVDTALLEKTIMKHLPEEMLVKKEQL